MRLLFVLFELLAPILLIGGGLLIANAMRRPTYRYVRFRQGELVLRRETLLGSKELTYVPKSNLLLLESAAVASFCSAIPWFTSDGRKVEEDSAEHQAIQAALNFAHNTGVLEVDLGR